MNYISKNASLCCPWYCSGSINFSMNVKKTPENPGSSNDSVNLAFDRIIFLIVFACSLFDLNDKLAGNANG